MINNQGKVRNMKRQPTLISGLLAIGAMFTQSVLSESWQCTMSAESDSGAIVDEGVDLPDPTTAATWVLIRSGGSSENRSYSWWFRYRNNDPAPAACQTLSSGSVQSTTGLYKEQTWTRTNYAWGETILECTTTGNWG